MKKIVLSVFILILSLSLFGRGTIVPDDVPVTVKYQHKAPDAKTWSNGSTVMRGAVTESMMRNQIKKNFPDHRVRILAADAGPDLVTQVSYQFTTNNKNWSKANTILYNALTHSMAKNQLMQRHNDAKIRILSIKKRKK